MENTRGVSMGTLYDLNKQGYARVPIYKDNQLTEKLEEIAAWLENRNCKYSMMLCHEQRDYTILAYNIPNNYYDATLVDLKECLTNRGHVLEIIYDEDQEVWQIWLRDFNAENYLYMFFDAEGFVVEV